MIRSADVRHVEVRSDEPIPAVLDGETVDLGKVAIVDFVQAAFNALVPRTLPDRHYGIRRLYSATMAKPAQLERGRPLG